MIFDMLLCRKTSFQVQKKRPRPNLILFFYSNYNLRRYNLFLKNSFQMYNLSDFSCFSICFFLEGHLFGPRPHPERGALHGKQGADDALGRGLLGRFN